MVAGTVFVPHERNRIILTVHWVYVGVRLGVKKLQRLGIGRSKTNVRLLGKASFVSYASQPPEEYKKKSS